MSHTLVPESLRAILLDLKNIEKLFAEKTNEAARANKAKVATALKGAGEHVPRKGNTELDDEAGHNHCKMSHDHYKSFCRLVLGLYYDTWALHHTERAFRNLIIQDLDTIMHYWDTDIYNMNCKPISYCGDRWDMARTLARLTLLLTGADACTSHIVASVWGEDEAACLALGGPRGNLSLIRRKLLTLSKVAMNMVHIWMNDPAMLRRIVWVDESAYSFGRW